LDLSAYDAFLKGELKDYELTDGEIKKALTQVEKLALR